MFTFWGGLSIGMLLGVILWNIGAYLGNAIMGVSSVSHHITKNAIAALTNQLGLPIKQRDWGVIYEVRNKLQQI